MVNAARWQDLRLRVISAALLIPMAVLCVWLGGLWFTAMVGMAVIAMGWEWWEMSGERPALLLPAALYILPAGVALVWLRGNLGAGMANVLFVLVLVWGSDIGAYLAGRLIGGPKLAPAISPGKTWSGAAGGLLAVALIGWLAALLGGGDGGGGDARRAVLVALALGVAAQLGDLLESGIKRGFGVKDSGWIIPGHGGVLDRLDAVLVAAPVAALIGIFVARGALIWQ